MTKDGTNVDATSKPSKFIEIVLDAIAKLGEKYGSSAKNILNYVRSNSKTINRNLTVQVQQALRRGVIGGQIKLCGSRYRLHCKRELKPPGKSEISEPKSPPSSPKSLRIKPKPLPTEPKSPVKEPQSNPKVSTKKTELPTSKLKIPKPEPPKTRSSTKDSNNKKTATSTSHSSKRKGKKNPPACK
ncbi:hypothetical protein QAD02_011361 [Eretmocerus hayati]|uniref:Uncharacterized protein n=1 Tax=Eretmocerus hayati TaxID=131215 RepID=A0ACC2NWK4_9HYME|nr:hypothetical protein QAD02_011361 [Eretmocerus hayati]